MPFTKIDCFEKLAQIMYCGMLTFAPAFWLGDNFADEGAPTNPTAIALANIMGVLCFCITVTTFLIRSNGVDLKTADFATALCWGACTYLTFTQQALYKPQAFKQNLGLQGGIVAMFLFQGLTRSEQKGGQKSE